MNRLAIERCGRRQLVLQTVSRRSEPSSRTALMGEQPNPWEVLPPQDATSRHRAISAVSGGADYLSTLHPIGARGRRLMVTIDFIHAWMCVAISPLASRADQSLQGHAEVAFSRLPTVLPSDVT